MSTVQPPFDAYACEGDGRFIFVSYAHSDIAVVFPELLRLHQAGYRIWYDEGIDPGNEWTEAIGNALEAAAFFLVFISPAAVASQNVRNEINYALDPSLKKGFIAVHIAETVLPPGLRLQMGPIQAVLKWRMDDAMYERKMAKVLSADLRDAPRASPSLEANHEATDPHGPVGLAYLPGDEVMVTITKEDAERGQGIACLDDRTMIVVNDSAHCVGQTVRAVVTSSEQTSDGRTVLAQLASEVRRTYMPGEKIIVQIVKEGKEQGQGVAYLDDGTMFVVQGTARFVGQTVRAVVTSVAQTSARRIIFADLDDGTPRGYLPGEEVIANIVKEGKEQGQGVAYMDDGAMVVVENAGQFVGEKVRTVVNSVMQTSAGRLVFADLVVDTPLAYLPGEEVTLTITKLGKDQGQGIAYLDDGTMVVVEGTAKFVGHTLRAVVTGMVHTATGKMMFADLAPGSFPVRLPREEIMVKLLREGREPGQGIAYLEDGTMVLLENESVARLIGQTVRAVITSTQQTSGGRIIFADLATDVGEAIVS